MLMRSATIVNVLTAGLDHVVMSQLKIVLSNVAHAKLELTAKKVSFY